MTATRPVALVTGASRGIGRRTALALAAAGHDVAFTARTVEEGEGRIPPRHGTAAAIPVPGSLARTTAEIEALGVRALPVQMDLLDRTSVQAAAQTVLDAWGRVDVLVNNAVAHIAGTHERFLDLDVDVAQQLATGNYLNQIVLLQAVLPAMLDQGGGTIVNLCSGSATSDPPGPPGEGGWGVAYSASKAAFGRLAGAINAEYLRNGIRAFNLDPGFVVTDAGAARGGLDSLKEKGFEATPEQAPAAAVVWLATSPDAQHWLGRVIWTPKLVADLALLR
ncbi:SDR family oxidoreductase [Actinomadura sp. BRA 177]|uniref:SDR family NAD(P)-dependent oxidoreductase n=1 Tax=Actinomadura sp. BRA 177 TaxID=2745202 RepID=UPI0015955B1B|nr:SDR family oxidoreductase [Actinomadura sp. BRA 177]NVI90611.1 SDR family oxidoreductase [Actinomadura sp. BRA 177]